MRDLLLLLLSAHLLHLLLHLLLLSELLELGVKAAAWVRVRVDAADKEPVVHVAERIRHEGGCFIVPPFPIHDEFVLVIPGGEAHAKSASRQQ